MHAVQCEEYSYSVHGKYGNHRYHIIILHAIDSVDTLRKKGIMARFRTGYRNMHVKIHLKSTIRI